MTSWTIRKKLQLLLLVVFLPAFVIIILSGLDHRQHEIWEVENNATFLVEVWLPSRSRSP